MTTPEAVHEIATEFLQAFGSLSAELANFVVQIADEATRDKLRRYQESDGFRLAVAVDMAPVFRIRLLATADKKEPFAVFEMFPEEAALN